MRTVLIALALLLLTAVVAFLILGFSYSGSHYRAEVEVQAPPAEVYRWLTEPDKLKQWVGWLVESRPLDDELKPGARSIETIRDEGVSFKMETEALLVIPEERLAFRLSAEGDVGLRGVSQYELSETAGATRLVLTQEIYYKPFYLRAMSPLIAGQVQEKLDGDFKRLKALVEQASG